MIYWLNLKKTRWNAWMLKGNESNLCLWKNRNRSRRSTWWKSTSWRRVQRWKESTIFSTNLITMPLKSRKHSSSKMNWTLGSKSKMRTSFEFVLRTSVMFLKMNLGWNQDQKVLKSLLRLWTCGWGTNKDVRVGAAYTISFSIPTKKPSSSCFEQCAGSWAMISFWPNPARIEGKSRKAWRLKLWMPTLILWVSSSLGWSNNF